MTVKGRDTEDAKESISSRLVDLYNFHCLGSAIFFFFSAYILYVSAPGEGRILR